MKFRPIILALCGLVLTSAAIMWSGAQLVEPEPAFQANPSDISDAENLDIPAPAEDFDQPALPVEPSTGEIVSGPADETEPLPPPLEQQPAQFERLPPREPLSDLAAPKDPAKAVPEKPGEAKSIRLFKPVATSAGTIEVQGYNIVLEGLQPVAADEQCVVDGQEWPCGARARTAFRSWLRGRAISCTVPLQPSAEAILSICYLGKTDLGQWLVENGWARSGESGPYVEAGRAAKEAGKGVFGVPPAQVELNLPELADPAPLDFPDVEAPVLELDEPLPPAVQPPLTGPFPPAPQSP